MSKVLLEVCPSCGGMMKAGRYICPSCERGPNKNSIVLMADKPEFIPKRYRGSLGDSICDICPMLNKCRERVSKGGHCYCEVPDESDYLLVLQDGAAIKLLEKRSPVTGRFEKGNIPWNVGMSSFDPSPDTHFKPGCIPQNTLAVGTEVESQGYIRRKIAEPNVWRWRSHIIWEEHYGRLLPDGWIVRHKDGNPFNDDPHNLDAMPRSRNLTETLKDPCVRKRKRDGTARANSERWDKYRNLQKKMS